MKRVGKPELPPEQICEVCRARQSVAVASMPFVPVSFAYCSSCLQANAHPYEMVVVNTALLGGVEQARDEWLQLIDDTLNHLCIPRERFDEDVAAERRDLDQGEGPSR